MNITTSIQNLPFYKIYLQVEAAARAFLEKRRYLRLDLPVLSPSLIPESYLEIFETEFRFFRRGEKLYLMPSPELFMKRLLAGGLGDCYYLGKAFRNSEPASSLHAAEFTLLEFYKVGADYMYLKKEITRLLLFIAQKVFGKTTITFKNQLVDLGQKWEEATVAEVFERYAKISQKDLFDYERFIARAGAKGYGTKNASYVDLFSQIYAQDVEPHLGTGGAPTIIYDYPKEMAALAKLNPDGQTAQRFEFYIAGVELGDVYTELTDWREQKARFIAEEKARRRDGKITHPIDWGFIEALKKGLPPCAGVAIGFDRLAMIFAGCEKIQKLSLVNIE